MTNARNKRIIRVRLADAKTMSAAGLSALGPENAEGLTETMAQMASEGELVYSDGMCRLPENAQISWDGGEPVPYDAITAICRGRPNMMISIGYTGIKRCYLNVGVDEAITRYLLSEGDSSLDGVTCEVISFHDSFGAYEVGT